MRDTLSNIYFVFFSFLFAECCCSLPNFLLILILLLPLLFHFSSPFSLFSLLPSFSLRSLRSSHCLSFPLVSFPRPYISFFSSRLPTRLTDSRIWTCCSVLPCFLSRRRKRGMGGLGSALFNFCLSLPAIILCFLFSFDCNGRAGDWVWLWLSAQPISFIHPASN